MVELRLGKSDLHSSPTKQRAQPYCAHSSIPCLVWHLEFGFWTLRQPAPPSSLAKEKERTVMTMPKQMLTGRIRAFLKRNFRNGRRDFDPGRGGGHRETLLREANVHSEETNLRRAWEESAEIAKEELCLPFQSIDRLIDSDRSQPIEYQDQSTFDRFLKSRSQPTSRRFICSDWFSFWVHHENARPQAEISKKQTHSMPVFITCLQFFHLLGGDLYLSGKTHQSTKKHIPQRRLALPRSMFSTRYLYQITFAAHQTPNKSSSRPIPSQPILQRSHEPFTGVSHFCQPSPPVLI